MVNPFETKLLFPQSYRFTSAVHWDLIWIYFLTDSVQIQMLTEQRFSVPYVSNYSLVVGSTVLILDVFRFAIRSNQDWFVLQRADFLPVLVGFETFVTATNTFLKLTIDICYAK